MRQLVIKAPEGQRQILPSHSVMIQTLQGILSSYENYSNSLSFLFDVENVIYSFIQLLADTYICLCIKESFFLDEYLVVQNCFHA